MKQYFIAFITFTIVLFRHCPVKRRNPRRQTHPTRTDSRGNCYTNRQYLRHQTAVSAVNTALAIVTAIGEAHATETAVSARHTTEAIMTQLAAGSATPTSSPTHTATNGATPDNTANINLSHTSTPAAEPNFTLNIQLPQAAPGKPIYITMAPAAHLADPDYAILYNTACPNESYFSVSLELAEEGTYFCYVLVDNDLSGLPEDIFSQSTYGDYITTSLPSFYALFGGSHSITLGTNLITPTPTIDINADHDGDGVPYNQDCNDNNSDIFPGADEICGDDIDNDCDGEIDEDCDMDGDGYPAGEDCNDYDEHMNPGAADICDGIDNDCDGMVDEECPIDNDYDGIPESEDCNDYNSSVGAAVNYYADNDGDGFGNPEISELSCVLFPDM